METSVAAALQLRQKAVSLRPAFCVIKEHRQRLETQQGPVVPGVTRGTKREWAPNSGSHCDWRVPSHSHFRKSPNGYMEAQQIRCHWCLQWSWRLTGRLSGKQPCIWEQTAAGCGLQLCQMHLNMRNVAAEMSISWEQEKVIYWVPWTRVLALLVSRPLHPPCVHWASWAGREVTGARTYR